MNSGLKFKARKQRLERQTWELIGEHRERNGSFCDYREVLPSRATSELSITAYRVLHRAEMEKCIQAEETRKCESAQCLGESSNKFGWRMTWFHSSGQVESTEVLASPQGLPTEPGQNPRDFFPRNIDP